MSQSSPPPPTHHRSTVHHLQCRRFAARWHHTSDCLTDSPHVAIAGTGAGLDSEGRTTMKQPVFVVFCVSVIISCNFCPVTGAYYSLL